MKNKIRAFYIWCRYFMNRINENHIDTYSACAAFYMFICVIPFMMAFLELVKYTPITKSDLLSAIVAILPNEMDPLGISILDELYGKSSAILSFSIVAAIWSAARTILVITKGLNEITGITEKRNYFVIRIWSSIYTVILIFLIVFMMVLGVYGEKIYSYLEQYIVRPPVSVRLLIDYKNIILVFVMFLIIMFLYCVLPAKRVVVKQQIPGACFSAVIWNVFTQGFSIYTSYAPTFSMYGSLTLIVIFLLWLYFGMYIFFVGAQINNCLTFH